MAKIRFSLHGLVIIYGTILVVGLIAPRNLVLEASYGDLSINICLNVSVVSTAQNTKLKLTQIEVTLHLFNKESNLSFFSLNVNK